MSIEVGSGIVRLDVPDGFRLMSEAELARFFQGQAPTSAWIHDGDQATLHISEVHDKALRPQDVAQRLNEFAVGYGRLTPGFQRGEMLLHEFEEGCTGIMTFKSSALTRDLFNIFAVMSVLGKEYNLLFTCSFDDTSKYLSFWSRSLANVRVESAV